MTLLVSRASQQRGDLFPDTDTLFESVRNKLLESGKEPVVVVAV
jgi:hypothetical protein